MYVLIDADFVASLKEADNLKEFKLVVRHPPSALSRVQDSLRGIATRIDQEHGWISEDWIRAPGGLRHDADWQKAFDGVVAYATGKGWVDATTGAIRAHIEWARS